MTAFIIVILTIFFYQGKRKRGKRKNERKREIIAKRCSHVYILISPRDRPFSVNVCGSASARARVRVAKIRKESRVMATAADGEGNPTAILPFVRTIIIFAPVAFYKTRSIHFTVS